jgi:hypothetical protein
MRRSNVTGKKQLRTKIQQFTTTSTQTMANPFRRSMEAKQLST